MAKTDKKKKSAAKKNSAHAEQERRHRVNEWMDLLHRVCVSCGAGYLFENLTDWERTYFEEARLPPFQLRKAAGHDVPGPVFSRLETMLRDTLRFELVHVPPLGRAVPIGDFIRAEAALRGLHTYCLKSTKPRAARWADQLGPLVKFAFDRDAVDLPPIMRLWSLMCYFSALAGNLDHRIYPVLLQWDIRSHDVSGMLKYFEISSLPAEHRHFQMFGQRRRSFRLFVQSVDAMKVYPAEMSTTRIPGYEDQPERRLPVYVQEHVRQRMIERLAPLGADEMDHLLGNTMVDPRARPARGGGGFLIEVKMYGCRLGYVVAERVEDAVLMRTFLFVTQSDTPEGERLNERLRLGKYEKTYFGLDRLETFIKHDLCLDPRFSRILNECGISDLIELARINRQVRRSLQVREGYAEQLCFWLNLDVNKDTAAANPPDSEVTAAGHTDGAPAPSPLRRRLRILRQGQRRPLTALVRRPPPPIRPAPAPPVPASAPAPSFPLPGPRRRAFISLNVRRHLRPPRFK